MATLTVLDIDLGGLVNPTLTAAAGGGDDFANDGRTLYYVNNGGGGAITVTFNDTGSSAPAEAKTFDPDVDVSVGAGEIALIGPFPTNRFGTSCGVTYSGVTTVTVAPMRFQNER